MGDCQDLMREMEPDSVDLIVTDPPYFMVDKGGSGFMGKSWDSINTDGGHDILCKSKEFAQFVTRFFMSMRVDLNMDVENTAHQNVNIKDAHQKKKSNVPAQCAEKDLPDTNHKSKVNTSSVRGLVLTKDDLSDLLSELSLNHTIVIENLNESALFVVPSLYITKQLTNIVQENVLKSLTKIECLETETPLTSMEEARINGVIEGMIGNRSDYKSTNETTINAKSAGTTANERKFKHITSSSIERRKIIHWIIWLLYVLSVIQTSNTTRKSFTKRDLIYDLIQKFHVNWMMEAHRILKPGAFAFIMSSPRQDVLSQMMGAASVAGFETGFTSIYWAYASGFPKAGNIGKMVDKTLGRNSIRNPKFDEVRSWLRKLVKDKGLTYKQIDTALGNPNSHKASHYLDSSQPQLPTEKDWEILKKLLDVESPINRPQKNETFILFEREVVGHRKVNKGVAFTSDGPDELAVTVPFSDQAKSLDGSYGGFQPKPAIEVIMVVMKPLSESTYVDQALKNQKGITWLDDGRIPYQNEKNSTDARHQYKKNIDDTGIYGKFDAVNLSGIESQGRFPANLLVCDDVLNTGQDTKGSDAIRHNNQHLTSGKGIYGKYNQKDTIGYADSGSFSRYFDLDAWFDTKFLPKEAQKTFPFMIVPKASKSEKGGATHPTVKPVKLFSWLMTIGSRQGDLVLDPFLGSGTALEAGYFVGQDVLGFDISNEWEHLYVARAHQHQGNLEDWF